jgi:hypothetical protein
MKFAIRYNSYIDGYNRNAIHGFEELDNHS